MRVVPGMEGIKASLEGGLGAVNLGPLDVSVWTICRISEGVECRCRSNTLLQNIKLPRGHDLLVLMWRLMLEQLLRGKHDLVVQKHADKLIQEGF